MHYWLLLNSDVRKPIGGVKQIHRLAEALTACGRSATIVQEDANFHPSWFDSTVNTINYSEWIDRFKNRTRMKDHALIMPETFLPLAPKYASMMPIIVFNQNASYTFGLSKEKSFDITSTINTYRSNSISHVLCVSEHDYSFLREAIGLPAEKLSLIRNGIEPSCRPSLSKTRSIAYMPRKNHFDADIVVQLVSSHAWFDGWHFVPIVNRTHAGVLKLLSSSLLFISFGHPEGFGLPVAEAMACGCAVAGYSGLGGRELFSLGKSFDSAEEVAFGDISGFVSAIRLFIKSVRRNEPLVLNNLLKLSGAVQDRYSLDMMNKTVNSFLDSFEKIS